jgi:Arc-like DNA binding domain
MAKKAEAVQVKVRMTKDLQRKIQREADRHGQTINAEILRRLESSFQSDRMFEGVFAPDNAKFVRMIGQATILAGDWRNNRGRFDALEEAIVWILYAAALDLVKREVEAFKKAKPTSAQINEELEGAELGNSIAQIVIANETPQHSATEVHHEHLYYNMQRRERNDIRRGRPKENPVATLASEITDIKGTTNG